MATTPLPKLPRVRPSHAAMVCAIACAAAAYTSPTVWNAFFLSIAAICNVVLFLLNRSMERNFDQMRKSLDELSRLIIRNAERERAKALEAAAAAAPKPTDIDYDLRTRGVMGPDGISAAEGDDARTH